MGVKIPRFDKFTELSIEKGGPIGISGAGQHDLPALFTQKESFRVGTEG